jgi:hypothetical protein
MVHLKSGSLPRRRRVLRRFAATSISIGVVSAEARTPWTPQNRMSKMADLPIIVANRPIGVHIQLVYVGGVFDPTAQEMKEIRE